MSQNLTTIWESFASLGYPQLNTEVRYTEGLSLVQSSQQLQSQVGGTSDWSHGDTITGASVKFSQSWRRP